MDIKTLIVDFICENFYVDKDDLDTGASLVEQGIIDSIGLVEISLFLEKEFKIESSQGEMNKENFGSVDNMVRYVNSKSEAKQETRKESGVI